MHFWIIAVDYKFGEKELPGHNRQVKNYVEMIEKMGLGKNVKVFVWYVEKAPKAL